MTQESNNKKEEQVVEGTQKQEGPRDWKSIAEVRMVLYVVPVAIIFMIIAWLMSRFAN